MSMCKWIRSMCLWTLPAVVLCASAGAAIIPAGVVDTTTQGDWRGVYGSDGYILAAFNADSTDNVSLPSYISGYTLSDLNSYTWATGSADAYDLLPPVSGTSRNIGTWYPYESGTVTLVPSQSQTFNLSVYLRDYGNAGRVETLSFTGAGLDGTDTVEVTEGKWITYTVTATAGTDIALTLGKQAGPNAVISAMMFSPVPEPATLTLLAATAVVLIRRRRCA